MAQISTLDSSDVSPLSDTLHYILGSPDVETGEAGKESLDVDNFEEHLFSRMMRCDECENAFRYLCKCYGRYSDTKKSLGAEEQRKLEDLLSNYCSLLLTNPQIVPTAIDFADELGALLRTDGQLDPFIPFVIAKSRATQVVQAISESICAKIRHLAIPMGACHDAIDLLIALCRSSNIFTREFIAQLPAMEPGVEFERSIMGCLLCKSCMPSWMSPQLQLGEELVSLANSTRSHEQYHTTMEQYCGKLHQLLRTLLNQPFREPTVAWLANLVNKFRYKGTDRSVLMQTNIVRRLIGDGALFNILQVMLQLSAPFCRPTGLTKVSFHYGSCKHCRLPSLSEDPMVVASDREVCECEDGSKTNFTSDCFYMTHVSMRTTLSRMLSLLRNVTNEIVMTSDIMRSLQEQGEPTPVVEHIGRRFDTIKCASNHIVLCLKQPDLHRALINFVSFTAKWILMNSLHLDEIPEVIVDNIALLVSVIDHVAHHEMLNIPEEKLFPMMKCIVIMMGSKSPSRNPHLKASLAQAFKHCIPNEPTDAFSTNAKCLSRLTEDRVSIVESILYVFVTIERTGQSVSFEEKFQYRISIHDTIAILYEHASQKYRKDMQDLARYAVDHMGDTDPPIFLRFVNLLLNDSNFLMDETFRSLAELRDAQNVDMMDTDSYTDTMHITSLCQYRCVCNSKTIETIRLLTMSIVNIFCHPTIIDRIAPMMNYFLDKLIGPENKRLKIKDNVRVGFDPKLLLRSIVMIMINLGRHEKFALACAKDRGCYGEGLYEKTVATLRRINCSISEIERFEKLAEQIEECVRTLIQDDEFYDDAPEEFVDCITNELMEDPVLLPVSKRILDRVTITRHILSDQTDPFNRLPLEIKDLIAQPELKERIASWKASKRHE